MTVRVSGTSSGSSFLTIRPAHGDRFNAVMPMHNRGNVNSEGHD